MTSHRFGLLAISLALGLGLLSSRALAARWDTYSNANGLNAARWTPGGVWAASDHGLHLFDPATRHFTRYSKSLCGLASNSISDVQVDASGDTWFASEDRGVSVLRKNGSWRTLSAFDGLPSDDATCLASSPLGMWIGTSGGLALFNGFTIAAVWPDGVNPSPFISNQVQGIALTAESTYVATHDGVYVTRSSEGVTWERRVQGLGSTDVTSITALGTEVWCVAGGVVERGGETGTWTPATTGLGGSAATAVFARNGVLLLGAVSGVFQWDGVSTWQPLGTGGFPGRAHPEIDALGGFWAGNPDGLWQYLPGATAGTGTWNLYTSPGPAGNWVQGLQLVGSKMYMATRDLGVSRFDAGTWRSFYPLPGAARDTTLLAQGSVFGLLAARDGTLWAGQWGGSIAHIVDATDPPTVTHYYDPQDAGAPYDIRNTLVWSSAQDRNGNVWFGNDTFSLGVVTPVGINEIHTDGSRSNFTPLNGQAMAGPQIRALTFAPNSAFELWVGYARAGVDVFTDPTLSVRAVRLSTSDSTLVNSNLTNNDTWAIEMYGDSVWIATSDGLARYSRATRHRVELLSTASPSSQGAIHPLSIDATGGVWWATTGGVFHRKTDRTVEVFNADNSPLLSDDVHSVMVDRATGDVWIGSVLGVNRYNAEAAPEGAAPVTPPTFGIYPNPALLSAVSVGLRAVDLTGPFLGKVYDARGRFVRDLLGNASSGGVWDGTDAHGAVVRPGLYFLKVQQGGQTRVGRVVLLR